jgi:putative FmdB family regulatory protein
MPIYDYQCLKCKNEFELFMPLKDWKLEPKCPDCLGDSKKIIVLGHGGIQDDHPVWLDFGVRAQIQDVDCPGEIPITTRTQYTKHLRDNGLDEI